MKVLLIPSAVIIPKDMQSIGKIPPIMYPINGYVILDYLYDMYFNLVDKIYIIVNENKDSIYDYVQSNRKLKNIKIVYLDEIKDLGYSIFKGIEYILEDNEYEEFELYINYGDTILKNKIQDINSDCVFYNTGSIQDKWTFFNEGNQGKIIEIIDKQSTTDIKNINKFFVGVFYITKGLLFNKYLKECINSNQYKNIDSFYMALKSYSNKISLKYIYADKWFDIGHSEKYVSTKAAVRPREFNQIQIDTKRGILTKTSDNKNKLIDEIRWYLKLPDSIKYMAPRIYEYSLDIDNPFVSMEYYSYHTLHELYLYGDLKEEQWKTIFNRIKVIMDDMSKYTFKDTAKIKDSLNKMYSDKTFERLNVLEQNDYFKSFFVNNIVVNEIEFPNLKILIEKLKTLIQEQLINTEEEFTIIHGDLCFTNILIDDKLNFLRLIDPRGKFGKCDIYGDKRYELAKLFHCLDGKYDYIIKDLFDIKVNKTQIELAININKNNNCIFECFLDVFKDDIKNIREIRLIESLLFLSMIPLHTENIRRQYAMLATGLLLLNKCNLIGEKND